MTDLRRLAIEFYFRGLLIEEVIQQHRGCLIFLTEGSLGPDRAYEEGLDDWQGFQYALETIRSWWQQFGVEKAWIDESTVYLSDPVADFYSRAAADENGILTERCPTVYLQLSGLEILRILFGTNLSQHI